MVRESSRDEHVFADCTHEVLRSELYHMGWGWNPDGIDLCVDCYKALNLGLYLAVGKSMDAAVRRMWDEAAWYVAERDHAIAQLGESIDLLESTG